MPLMMNEAIDIDLNDLFDDGDGLPLPSRPSPKELFQRVDELRGSGCCQGVAWSRWGCIASIVENGKNLEFRNLRCHPRDGSWDVSEPTVPHFSLSSDNVPFQHLCWSPNGTDLAAIDAAGRISIFTASAFLNTPNLARNGQTDPSEDLNAAVGAYWLNVLPPQQRPPNINSLAIKNDKGYRYEMAQATCYGPCYPNPQKSALLCLTTNGALRLIWLQSDSKWHETVSEIESVVSSNDLITHATICADRNQTLLIAFATTTKQLRTVRVHIKWGNKPNEKTNPNAPIPVNPSISVSHLAVSSWMDGAASDGSDSFHLQSSMVELSHLLIIPPTPDGPGGQATLPTVLAVRSHLPMSPSHFSQDVHSTIDRWELRESAQPIHSAFEQLGSRRRSGGGQTATAITLKKLDGFVTNKVVVFVQAINLDRILCFAYSDGSFEYRDRASLAETFTEGGPDRFAHLSQIGFSYTDEEPCLQLALSPTSCSFVQICCDGKLKWSILRHHMDQVETPMDDAEFAAVSAGLSMCLSAAVMSSINYDDILIIAHRYTTRPTFPLDLLSDVARVLNFHVDYSDESHHDTLVRNPSVQLCLSVLNSLGYNGDLKPRKFGAKMSWISLQIRNCVVLMTMTTSLKYSDPEHPQNPQKKLSGIEDADAMRLLSGSVRWCLDLMNWLVDCLLHPDDTSLFKSISSGEPVELDSFNSSLQASGNVALHLLLSSTSRGFMTAICRRLTHLDYTARKAMSNLAQSQTQSAAAIHLPQPLLSNDLRAAYTTIATLTSASIVQVRNFEDFLQSISASIKDAYTSAGLSATAGQSQSQQQAQPRHTVSSRNAAELMMLFGGPIPSALLPTVRHIFTSLLPTLRSGIDPAKLFFQDFSLLRLEPPPLSLDITSALLHPDQSLGTPLGLNGTQEKKASSDERFAHTVDIFKRVPVVMGQDDWSGVDREIVNDAGIREIVPEKKSFRRCARCTAVMENISSRKPAVAFMLIQQKRCFCGANWDVLSGRQIVA